MDQFFGAQPTVSGSLPIFGQTGGVTSTTFGTVTTNYGTRATYTGTTFQPITFGQVGSIPYRRKQFDRYLFLSILDPEKSTEKSIVNVFEGRVLSSGSSEEISMVLPTMIEALFKKFPGENGKAEKVILPMR